MKYTDFRLLPKFPRSNQLRERSSLVPRRKAKTALASARGVLGENATNEGCFFHRVLPKHPRALALACVRSTPARSLSPVYEAGSVHYLRLTRTHGKM